MACVALQANHQDGSGRGLNYIIERGGKTLLYALDTCWFPDESLERIGQFRYDVVVLDATYGVSPEHDEQHNNLALVERAYALFQEHGLLKEGARFCISHISPHWNPIHDDLAPMMAEKGITVPYDGLTIEV